MSESDPAFPSHGSMGEVNHQGMSLRDYFAAAALTGALAASAHPDVDQNVKPDLFKKACVCYELADAMIAARDSHSLSKTEAAHLGYGG